MNESARIENEHTRKGRYTPLLVVLALLVAFATGCGSSGGSDKAADADTSAQAPDAPAGDAAGVDDAPQPVTPGDDPTLSTQEAEEEPASDDEPAADEPTGDDTAVEAPRDCDWDSAQITGVPSDVATGQDGDFPDILIGSWQHVAFDEGGGPEPVSMDIRFVFPSTDEIIYCQGGAENRADITIQGTTIVIAGPGTRYTATAWDDDTMVWKNETLGDDFILARR